MNKKIEVILDQHVMSYYSKKGYKILIKDLNALITSAVEEAQKKQMEVDSVYKNQCVEAEKERCIEIAKSCFIKDNVLIRAMVFEMRNK